MHLGERVLIVYISALVFLSIVGACTSSEEDED